MVEIKRGDTKKRRFRLTQKDPETGKRAPVNLTGISEARFLMKALPGTTHATVSAVCTVTDALGGVVEWAPVAGDVDAQGNYRAEVQITYADTTKQTIPDDGYLQVQVVPDLG